ncbi:hypothetical protein Poli38472_004186 [Pythium oligandrum]|uniref:RING-type E3 ubiquitin transferase n=1 Tax=Pythium oligandrum TaxID=41045 RepID=A0A8K1FKU1_PYTOL|nr:hypothetical protein Poli38472_004186 [Pythium oligandrum]|eukprot:TMW66421.1 hypothetical protein Poli38472_004186 [Pythium oligandrum]
MARGYYGRRGGRGRFNVPPQQTQQRTAPSRMFGDAESSDSDSSSSDDSYDYEYAYEHPWGYMDEEEESESSDEDIEDDDDDSYFTNNSRRQAPVPAQPLAPPPPTLCRFFVLGKCRFGSRCTYSHNIPGGSDAPSHDVMASAAATLVDCPFFQRGNCKYGDYCRLRHGQQPTAAAPHGAVSFQPAAPTPVATTAQVSPSNQSQEFTCGICFEDIVEAGKYFGLMSCDHCFCLDCLRSWRQSKDMEAEVTRACPACRAPSNFIVPSLTFCTGQDKEQVVDAYKRHLAIRECKYFDGTFGSCPFGPHCFYAHRDASGRDVKHLDRPRKRMRGGHSRRGDGQVPDALASLLDSYSQLFRFLESFDWEEYDLRQETTH